MAKLYTKAHRLESKLSCLKNVSINFHMTSYNDKEKYMKVKHSCACIFDVHLCNHF